MFDPYDMKAQKERKPYVILLLVICALVILCICWTVFHEITDILTDKADLCKKI